MKINNLIAILELLQQAGLGEEDLINCEPDVIILPVTGKHPIHDDFENKLVELGAQWSKNCWVISL